MALSYIHLTDIRVLGVKAVGELLLNHQDRRVLSISLESFTFVRIHGVVRLGDFPAKPFYKLLLQVKRCYCMHVHLVSVPKSVCK